MHERYSTKVSRSSILTPTSYYWRVTASNMYRAIMIPSPVFSDPCIASQFFHLNFHQNVWCGLIACPILQLMLRYALYFISVVCNNTPTFRYQLFSGSVWIHFVLYAFQLTRNRSCAKLLGVLLIILTASKYSVVNPPNSISCYWLKAIVLTELVQST